MNREQGDSSREGTSNPPRRVRLSTGSSTTAVAVDQLLLLLDRRMNEPDAMTGDTRARADDERQEVADAIWSDDDFFASLRMVV